MAKIELTNQEQKESSPGETTMTPPSEKSHEVTSPPTEAAAEFSQTSCPIFIFVGPPLSS
jgi:hypothetical protein